MSLRELKTAAEVIDALGGNRPVATLIEGTPGQVSNWRGFNRIPCMYVHRMLKALKKKGLTAPLSMWGVME